MSLATIIHFSCAQHVSDINIPIIRSLRLYCRITTLVVLFLVRCVLEYLGCSGVRVAGFSLHKDTTPPQPNHTVTPTHNEPEQYNTWNKSTTSRKLLKMDVLTFETCWAVNSEIIKQVTSSWSIFIQLPRW
jgi:hypothetical protein